MKSLIFLLLLLPISILSHAQSKKNTSNFTLKGTITGNVRRVILIYPDIPGQRRSYTIHVKNGHFLYKGYLSSPVYAGIMNDDKVDPNNTADVSNFTDLFLSPGNMTISLKRDYFDQAKITGSPAQDEWAALQKSEEPINKIKIDLYHQEFEVSKGGNTPKNHAAVLAMGSKIDRCQREMDQMDYQYIVTHSQSYVSSYLLSNYALGGDMPLDSIEKPYNVFSEAVKKSPSGKAIGETIASRKAGSVGTIVQMPAAVNLDGNKFNPTTFKIDNYALLYFWADWANDNIHLKEIYNKYHLKGLNVLAISMDPFKRMWRDSVKKEHIEIWNNVFGGMAGNLDTFYNIREMAPSLILLIDKNHKVIGRYRGIAPKWYKFDYQEGDINTLDKKLAELYKK